MHDSSMAQEEPKEELKSEGKEVRDAVFQLTQEEFADKAKAAAELKSEADKLAVEFEEVKQSFKARISLKDQELAHILAVIKSGKETREVECDMKFDYDRGVVEYWYKGELKDERTMDAEERQGRLPV